MANGEMCFTMLGRRGVGKTSMLAAMYDTVQRELEDTPLEFGRDNKTAAILHEALVQLKQPLEDPNTSLLPEGVGIPGTKADMREFSFTLGPPGEEASVHVKFYDFPGQWLHADGDQTGAQKVEQIVKTASAILVPVDAAPLMERKGEYNDRVNAPAIIKTWISNGFRDLEEPRLVILAPIRCESYLRTPEDASRLADRVKTVYKPLLKSLATEALRDKVAVVITPVQTLGCVVFSHFDSKDGMCVPRFRKTVPGARYRPKDCEQPMRYLLSFFIARYLASQEWGPLLEWLRVALQAVFGRWDEEMIEAGKHFARKIKRNRHGFGILQGKDLLLPLE